MTEATRLTQSAKTMFRKILFIIVCLVSTAIYSHAQTREELQKKEQDLQQELADLNKLYNKIQNNKKTSLKQLAIIKSKINKRQELINSINRQVRQLDETIFENERDIYRLRKELDTLKIKYAKSIVFAYKNRSSYEYLNFLFSASDFNDAIKRIMYLKSYRQNREAQANAIVKSGQVLQDKITQLSSNKKDRLSTLQSQNEQLRVLQDDKKQQDQVVAQLKGQEKDVTRQINEKENQRQKVRLAFNAIIRREIEEARKKEAARKAAEAKKSPADNTAKNNANAAPSKSGGTGAPNTAPVEGVETVARGDREYTPLESTPEGREISLSFENNKGRLPWPVSTGVITGNFGIEKIPGTKLTRKIDGIEITVPVGTPVKSIADGKVVFAGEVAGEPFIVVQHGKYFSGYNYLSSVSVSSGQEVKAGSVLGKSGTSLDGEGVLLLMIMNDKSIPLNPEPWLRPHR
ncbi:MAG TPA: peptidoglycan DD-metalloendopeptidase family protein [Sediminibacterium sp.]|nr:peptidoglycan DD-metalloendopeptidase family protein [Sediminibacterium sp.]